MKMLLAIQMQIRIVCVCVSVCLSVVTENRYTTITVSFLLLNLCIYLFTSWKGFAYVFVSGGNPITCEVAAIRKASLRAYKRMFLKLFRFEPQILPRESLYSISTMARRRHHFTPETPVRGLDEVPAQTLRRNCCVPLVGCLASLTNTRHSLRRLQLK